MVLTPLPPPTSIPQCTQLVDEYYVIIYDFLVNQLRAHTVCQAVGLCSSRSGAAAGPLWVTVPAESEAAAVLSAGPERQGEVFPLVKLTPAQPHKGETGRDVGEEKAV